MPGVVDILRRGAAPAGARALCVFVHGRGQSPEEMDAEVIRHLAQPDVAYALPRAGAATWYAARATAPLTAVTRADLSASLSGLAALIGALRSEAPGRPLVLAGFSQGACLALEHAFTGTEAPDAVAALTGCRVGVTGDARPAALPSRLPVYLSGGSDDPWIPVSAMAEAASELGRAGAELRTDLFPDRPHAVSSAEVAMLGSMLADLAAGRAPGFGTPR